MTERAIEAAARPLRWKLADAISFAVTGTVYTYPKTFVARAPTPAAALVAALLKAEAK